MQEYVVGFAFGQVPMKFSTHVVLIQKERPTFQAGLLNGVGGKVEPQDRIKGLQRHYNRAMVREFQEETGVVTSPDEWRLFAVIQRGKNAVIYYLYTDGVEISEARTLTDEKIFIVSAKDFDGRKQVKPDLRWLVPMALNHRDDIETLVHYIRTEAQ